MNATAVDLGDVGGGEGRAESVSVYLDGADEPIAEYAPPARIVFDTRQMEDGEHELQIDARGADGRVGRQRVTFEVRNGPAISVEGLRDGDVVQGDVSLVVHAWGGASEEDWEPKRAESPAPIPTWAWVLLIGIFAWAVYYAVLYWQPHEPYEQSPTYQPTPEQSAPE